MAERTVEDTQDVTEQTDEMALAGGDSSGNELELAQHTEKLLARLVTLAGDENEASQHLHDLGQLLLHPLDEPQRALSALRSAHQKHAAVHTARGYRKAAVRAASKEDVLLSLEAEARLASGAVKASLEVARGALLADNPAAARHSYEAALVAQPNDLGALWGLVELDQKEGNLAAAAERARQLGEAVSDEQAKGDLLAWAARLAERAGRVDLARAALVQAELHGHSSPAVRFLAERLHADTAPRAHLTLLEAQIADGTLGAAEGWLEVGAIARYLADDPATALRAFGSALAALPEGDAARAAVLAELAELRAQGGELEQAVAADEERLALETDATERALGWTRIGAWREESLDDVDGAATAYGRAVELAPGYVTALEGAGRTYGKLGDGDRLLAVHLAEAEQTSASADKATALRRAGELLLADPARVEIGVGYLDAASRLAPQHAGIFLSLERALRRRKDFAALADLYERELEHTTSPRRRAALHLQIGSLAADQLGDTKRAIAAYRAAAAIPGGAPDHALSSLARLLDEGDELTELEPVLAELTTLTDDPVQIASLYERAAHLREQRGDVGGAVDTYLKALATAPASHSIHAAAGRAFARAGRWDALLAAYEHAVEDSVPAVRTSAGYKLGFVLARKLGRVDDGIAQLERVRAEAPDHLPTLALLAAIYTEQRRWATLRTILSALPQTMARRVRRALLAEGLGHLDEALALWADVPSVTATRARLRILARLGRFAELADAYEALDAPLARYRAAELRQERTNEPDKARALLEVEPEPIATKLALLRALPASDPTRRALLVGLVDSFTDVGLRTLLQTLVVAQPAPEAEQLAALQKLLSLSPRDPVALVQLEARLELQRQRTALVTLLRSVQRDSKQDDGLVAAASARLGLVLEELGSAREAIDAYELAASLGGSLLALLALPRLYRSIGDAPRVHHALEALTNAMPRGAERVPVLRRLATDQRLGGDKPGAAATLEWALREAPRAYDALRELDELVGEQAPERVVDALLRALPLEPPGPQRLDVGMALAVRQLEMDRLDPARETIERVLADDADHLRAHLLSAELETRASRWEQAATALSAIVAHADTPPEVKREALSRLARVQVEHLADFAGAQKTALQLDGKDLATLELQLTIAEKAGVPADIAERLRQLVVFAGIDEDRRADAQLRLAQIEDELGDTAKAITTLGEVRLPSRRRDAVDRLLELGGKSDRWDLAASALEATLDRAGDMEGEWEIAIRRRLASLLEGPLQRGEAAVRQYERIVALDPGDVPTLERLAKLSEGTPAKAIELHRALLAADPVRLDSWRALRTHFAEVKDEDGAFLVEALLEASGVANEEESYFYTQRRSRLKAPAEGVLSAEERALLAPEAKHPAFALLHFVTPVLDKIFPVDWAAYGAAPEGVYAGPLAASAEKMAALFGVTGYRIVTVPSRVGPCVEPPALLVVPRGAEEAPPREQAAVLGELFARIAFDSIAGDPKRATRMSTAMMDYLVGAVCELAHPDGASAHKGKPVYEDIKRRVAEATQSLDLAALASVAARVTADPIAAEPLFAAMDRVACRAALLCAQDPFLAVTSLRERAGAAGAGLDGLPPALRQVLPFLVSAGHLALRRRLQMGVSS